MAFDDGVKTVSGSIAHTDDAAAKVPFVSVKCGIEPTLSGVSAITEAQTGRNLLDGINGYTVLANTTAQTLIGSYEMVANVAYTLSCSMTGTPTARTRNRWAVAKSSNMWDGTAVFGNDFYTAPQQTFTPSENGTYYFFIWSQGIDVDVSYDNFMLEYGSTAHDYEPYNATQYTASLGRTIYGGEGDIVNGEGTETHKGYTLDNLTWLSGSISDIPVWYVDLSADGLKLPTNSTIFSGVCDNYTPIRFNAVKENINTIALRDNGRLYVNNGSDTTQPTGKVTIELATETDFTFTPITPTPETVGKVNNVYCNTGDTELTYYDNAHGFAEVTVNKTGKNLFDISKVATTGTTAGISWSVSGNEITISGTATSSGWKSIVQFTLPKKGTYHFHMNATGNVGYFLRGYTQLVGTDVTEVCNDTSQVYRIAIASTTAGQTYEGTISEIQIEVGDSYTEYEPYEAVSKTAYLHKVIYGGQADVVKGTCEQDWSDPWTWTSGMSGVSVNNKGVCYINKSDVITVNASNQTTLVGCKCADDSFEPRTWAGLQNATTNGCACVYGNGVAIRIQGYTTKDEYEAYLAEHPLKFIYMLKEPTTFSFPPISISTDEGENTLFANEGDSAITYRKAVD